MSASFVDRAKDRYQAYREYAEAVIESKHTYIELQLAEMVLELLELLEVLDRTTRTGGTRDGHH